MTKLTEEVIMDQVLQSNNLDPSLCLYQKDKIRDNFLKGLSLHISA